jgi:hypothetical protein
MIGILEEAIADKTDPRALPSLERVKKLAEIRQHIDEAEWTEEAAIVAAAKSGIVIERRPDASPQGVLLCRVVGGGTVVPMQRSA